MDRYEGFERLSRNVHLHRPPNDDNGGSVPGPLIILCTWMSASPKLVGRYADRFVSDFPKSSVLLVTISVSEFVHVSVAEWAKRVAPAIDVVLAAQSGEQPVHACAYSNGGAQTLIQLAQSYRSRTGQPLPVKKLVLDSAPGSPEITVSHRAMLLSINPPTWSYPLAWPLMWVYLALAWIYMAVFNVENPIEGVRQRLNDTQLFESDGAKRVYIYSKEDQMVPWEWVEASARLAEKRGWNARLELCNGSKHVAHAAQDKERYWGIVGHTLA